MHLEPNLNLVLRSSKCTEDAIEDPRLSKSCFSFAKIIQLIQTVATVTRHNTGKNGSQRCFQQWSGSLVAR